MPSPILVLGAGINGAAIARELALRGCSVEVVDAADVACGATAYSSRLIHGGLRYLEYGDFALVRESIAERQRLIRLAPHFVRPLRFLVPVSSRLGGWRSVAGRFLRWPALAGRRSVPRGAWLVRAGLRLYDWYARDPTWPRAQSLRLPAPDAPQGLAAQYRWGCTYFDAQVRYPERFTLALLQDAAAAAERSGARFRVWTYHRAELAGPRAAVRPVAAPATVSAEFAPAAIVNATGAWADATLRQLQTPGPRLIGGTKGSHFVTYHPGLQAALRGVAIYVEADDGRPIFILPWCAGTLVGTTDERYEGDPADAVASAAELAYLVRNVQALFPGLQFSPADVAWHYSGVRPLPYVTEHVPAAVSRRHAVCPHAGVPPVFSIVGGKLTTCRALAEEAAELVCARLGRLSDEHSRDRPWPGAHGFPRTSEEWEEWLTASARQTGFSPETVARAAELWGAECLTILGACEGADRQPIAGLPRGAIRHAIRQEWVVRLEDLCERRLMLLAEPNLARRTLHELAGLLVEEGRLAEQELPAAVEAVVARLQRHYGKPTR